MISRCLLPVVIASLACGVPAFAQKISVRAMALTSENMPELYLKTDGDKALTLVAWPSRQPSEPIVALRDGALPLYRRETDDKGKESLTVAHRVKVPADAGEIVLLGWSDGGEIRLHAVKDDFMGADFNDWLLINFSSKVITFRIGEGSLPIKLKDGDSRIYRIAVPRNKGATALGQAMIRGEAKTFYSTFVPVKDGQRTIMLFADDGEKIRTKRIIDRFLAKERPTP